MNSPLRYLLLLPILILAIWQYVTLQNYNSALLVPQEFVSIQAAIDAAESGDRILVDARRGPYTESVVIHSENLRLESIQGQAEIISTTPEKPVVHILGSGIQLIGFELSSGSTGVVIEQATNVELIGNVITNNLQGIGLIEASESLLKTNEVIENGSIGILLQASQENMLVGNLVSGNPIGGIFFEQTSDQNTIHENTIQASDMGIRLMTSHENKFVKNQVLENGTFGISIESSQAIFLESNKIRRNDVGISALNANGLSAIRNSIAENSIGMEFIGSVSRVVVSKNSFVDNLEFSVLNSSPEEIEAFENYWGNSEGPSIADGNSNQIGGPVLFVPWLTEPINSEND